MIRPRAARALLAGTAACLFLAISRPSPVEARASIDLPWALKDIYGVALRFVRVDRGCKIADKDPEAAFITFDCNDDSGKATKHGSIEFFAAPNLPTGQSAVRVQLTLSDEPRYVEMRFLDLFERKVKDERGPPLPPPHAKPAPLPDGGAN